MALPSGIITAKPGLGKAQKANLAPRDKRLLWPTARPDAEKRSAGGGRESLYTTLEGLGKVGYAERIVIDSADANCYPGTGQILSDISGNAQRDDYDFTLGFDGSSASDEPTFVGTAGDMSPNTYFSLDGADFFRTAAGLPGWVQNVSKSSAGVFTVCVMLNYIQDPAQGHQAFMGTNYPTSGYFTGFNFMIEGGSAYAPSIYIGKGFSASDGFYNVVDNALPNGPHMLALSFNNGSSSFYYRDVEYDQVGGADTFTPTISANGSADPSDRLGLCAGPTRISSGVTYGILCAGTKFYSCFLDNTAWTKEELDGVWAKVQPWLATAEGTP